MSVSLDAHMATMSATANIGGSTAPGPSLSDAILALSPAGYWKLDDASSPAVDSSGNGRNSNATSNVTYQGITGPDGNDYATLPGNHKIPVADNIAWTPNGAHSFFILHRPTSIGTDKCLVCKGPSGWEWAVETVSASGEMRSTLMTSAGALIRSNTSPAGQFVVNEWGAYCTTFDGVTTAATIQQYKNSSTPLTDGYATGAGTLSNTASVLELTARTDTTVNAIIGAAAHIAVFNSVLTPTEVQSIMDAAIAEGWISEPVPAGLAPAIEAASPLAYWKMDDASGAAVDYGSRAVNATAVGSPSYQALAGPDGNNYVNLLGSDSNYFQVTDAADLGITAATGKTFMAAYYPTSYVGRNLTLFGKLLSGADRDYGMFVVDLATREMSWRTYQDASAAAHSAYESPLSPSTGAWHFVIARVNTDGTVTFWHDSTTPSTTTLTAPTGTAEQDGSAPLGLGRLIPFSGYNSYGLAHMAIVDGAMSDVDIEAIMQEAIDEGWTV